MSKTLKYHLYNGDRKIGVFVLVDREPAIKFIDNLDPFYVPIDFCLQYTNGEREFRGRKVKEWICSRVVPSGRQNIDSILRQVGIEEYDELAIFLFANGRFTQDNYHIKLIE